MAYQPPDDGERTRFMGILIKKKEKDLDSSGSHAHSPEQTFRAKIMYCMEGRHTL